MTKTACPAKTDDQVKAYKKFITTATGQTDEAFGATIAMSCGAEAIAAAAKDAVKVLASAAAGFAAIASLMWVVLQTKFHYLETWFTKLIDSHIKS